jgi:hypothetical protein
MPNPNPSPNANESDAQALLILALHRSIRRICARLLATPGVLAPRDYRLVQHYMRMALALAGAEGTMPTVQFHGVKIPGSGMLPEIVLIPLPDFLATRAADHLADALEGDSTARAAVEAEAERILLNENVQLL